MPNLPPELLVLLTAMLPIVGIKGAIPLGLLLHLPVEATFLWAQIGNIIPILFILKLLGPISDLLRKHFQFFEKFFSKLFGLTRQKHSQKFEKWGEVFLVIFLSIPLPGSGSWTGALLAFIFDIPYWKAVGLIFLGSLGAGILITLGFGSALEVAKMFIK